MFSNIFFSRILLHTRYAEKYCRSGQAADGNIIWRMSFQCWITKDTNTHSEYVVLISFPQQQWLHKHASILRYIYALLYIWVCVCVKELFFCHIRNDPGQDMTLVSDPCA
jgi:hypothetical protein